MLYVGGRLRYFQTRWKYFKNRWALNTVRSGHKLQFWRKPFQRRRPKEFRPDTEEGERLLDEYTSELLAKRATKEVTDPREIAEGFESQLILVKKKGTNKWRPCLSARELNEFITYHKFKMEGLPTVKKLVKKGDWLTKVDLSDAYFHVPIHPEHQKYLQFRWRGKVYRFTALPFGVASAPRIFTKVLRPIIQECRRRGVRVVVYLDDLLIISHTRKQAAANTKIVTNLLKKFGFKLNDKKSDTVPKQRQEFLGTIIDTNAMQLQMPEKKLKKFIKEARQIVQKVKKGIQITTRKLAGIIGKLNSMAQAIKNTRTHLNGLQHDLRRALRAGKRSRKLWSQLITLSHHAVQDLVWWTTEAVHWNGITLLPLKFHKTIYTDASFLGYGGVVVDNNNHRRKRHTIRGFWSRHEDDKSINVLEMMAVHRTLKAVVKHLQWDSLNIELFVDNITTMVYINKGSGRYPHLAKISIMIHQLLEANNLNVVCRYVNTKDNVLADQLSRWKQDRSDYRLNPGIFQHVDNRWGPHTIDWTATRLNTQLPRFCSWTLDDRATYIDVGA